MKKIRMRLVAAWISSFAVITLLSSCNIYEPFYAKRDSQMDYRGLLIKGNNALNRGDYVTAEDYYLQAQKKNPQGSEAYLFYAQAIVARYHLDFNQLKLEFECKRATRNSAVCKASGIDTVGIPFIKAGTTPEKIDSVYYPVAMAVKMLNYILRDQKKDIQLEGGYVLPKDSGQASDGRVSPGVARLDLGLLLAINGMLAPLDMDGNLRIDRNCGANFITSLNGLSTAINDSLKRARCGMELQKGEESRLTSFIKLTLNVKIDNLDSKDVRARNMSLDPNDINAFIASMQLPIASSIYNLDSVDRTLKVHTETALSGEISGVVHNVRDLNNFLSYMVYNDYRDNDYDGQDSAKQAQPMLWHNFDRDTDPNEKNHGIRYDYNDGTDFTSYPLASGDIGYPIHRFLHKQLYYTFDALGKANRKLGGDTLTWGVFSKNSRFELMKKKCHEIVDSAKGFTGITNNKAALDDICNTLSPVLLPTTPMPFLSDWVGGKAGIDEELIDEFDNDYDGIKDEDARNYKGYDDDDDALLNLSMRGSPVPPMVWADANGNTCIDINKSIPWNTYANIALGVAGIQDTTTQKAFKRAFCVGTIENRLYLARVGGPKDANGQQDSLKKYYSEYVSGDPAKYAHKNCTEDFEKLDASFRNIWFPDTNLVSAKNEKELACHYKHIWIAPRPTNSEWTSGVYGVDEEKYDCIDNDGDGWKDEDLSERRTQCYLP